VRPFATGGGTECFVAFNDEFAIVAFRGSEITPREGTPHDFSHIIDDWVKTNANIHADEFGGGARAHRGFANGAGRVWDKGLRDLIERLNSRKVWFTGHSLGAALATAAAFRAERIQGLYTYGSPRVGDVAFAQAFSRKFAGMGGDRHFRFVHDNDVVTVVPPNGLYRHVGSLRHFSSGGRVSEDPTALALLSDTFRDLGEKALALLRIPFGDSRRKEAKLLDLFVEGVIDHVPTFYATHTWNAYVEAQGGGD
jgi:predicted lipase